MSPSTDGDRVGVAPVVLAPPPSDDNRVIKTVVGVVETTHPF